MLRGRKGIVFTLDAFLSVFILVALAASVFYFSAQSTSTTFTGLQETRLAGDALKVMTFNGALESMDEAIWANNLTFFLQGSSLHYNLTVDTYQESGGVFSLLNSASMQPGSDPTRDLWNVKSHFVSFENGAIANYSIARLKVWR